MTPDQIRDLRRRHGLTQQELATRLRCSIGAVRDWEQGKHAPTGLYLDAIERLERISPKGNTQ